MIGAGHAGLAVSYELSRRSIDHVVLERGQVANTWRTERWDSLRLLTPNWQTRLPGHSYSGDDPDGFMTVPEVVDFVDGYARLIDAPVVTGAQVESLRAGDNGYEIATPGQRWEAASVVIASGGFNLAQVPPAAADLPPGVRSITPIDYRSPDHLGEGGVLVVGASATGAQIAEEILRSGRRVTISVGEHVRMPRVYRGADIFTWLDRIGRLDERYDQIDDLVRARHVPSPQLVGSAERRTLDLNALTAAGATLVGRLTAIVEGTAHFSGSLANVCKLADLKQRRLLETIDEWVLESGDADGLPEPERYRPTAIEDDPALSIDLAREGIETAIWATGYRADYSWLHLPVLDRKGEIRHEGGVIPEAPGIYRIGLNFLRRRKSSFIHGAEDDARDLVEHLEGFLHRTSDAPWAGALFAG